MTELTDKKYRDATQSAEVIANQIISRALWLQQYKDDLISSALKALLIQQEREEVRNVEAFFTTVMRRRIIDIQRRSETKNERLGILGEQIQAKVEPFGVSDAAIAREMEKLRRRQIRAVIASIPNDEDRELIRTWLFSEPKLSLKELGALYGGRSPQAISNYLSKYFGTATEPGALLAVVELIELLNERDGEAFVRVLETFEDRDLGTDPVDAAIVHIESVGKISNEHRTMAKQAASHLRWLRDNTPNNRGLINKVLRRLVYAACFYVVEGNDSRPDRAHPLGLNDDVLVLRHTTAVVRRYRSKS